MKTIKMYPDLIKLGSLSLILLFVSNVYSQTSLSLVQAIDYAIEHNQTLKLNQLDAVSAENRVKEIKSTGIPQVNAGLSYNYYFAAPVSPVEDFITPAIFGVLEGTMLLPEGTYTGPPDVFEFGFVPKNNLKGELNASWLIFDGSYIVAIEAAKLYTDLIGTAEAKTIQEVKANVTKSYLNILLAKINKTNIENNIKNLSKTLNETKEIYKEGFIEQLDVQRLDLSLERLKTENEKLDQLILLSENVLKFQLNMPYDEQIVLTENIEMLVETLKLETLEMPEFDISKRAEWKEIEIGEELQALNVKRFKKGYYPSVSAFASASESLQRNSLFDNDEAGWLPTALIGINVNIPIYDGGMKKAQIQQAQIEVEKVKIQKEEFRKGIEFQVSNAKIQFSNAKKSLSLAEKNLELSENIYSISQIKYKEGVGSSLELSQAESAVYAAQSEYMNAIYNLVSAKAEIDIALGNL